jgi:hypothetical protein
MASGYVVIGTCTVPDWLHRALIREVGEDGAEALASDPTTLNQCLVALRARINARRAERAGLRKLADLRPWEQPGDAA